MTANCHRLLYGIAVAFIVVAILVVCVLLGPLTMVLIAGFL